MSEAQLPLGLPPPARRRARAAPQLAETVPVARVAVLTPLPHLDRPLDYAVPAALSDVAQPGVRVRVRLAGRLVDGFLLERVPASDRALQPLGSVHGPPVLTAPIARLCREVADRYAGTFADVVRSAVPPRHARVELRVLAAAAAADLAHAAGPGQEGPAGLPSRGGDPQRAATDAPEAGAWRAYRGGRQLVAAVAAGDAVRASWLSGPGEDVPARIAELCAAAATRGRGALVVAPDGADVALVATALAAAGVQHVDLTAATGPQSRYRAFLRVLLGEVPVVVGTRGAVFSPVHRLGLLVVLDDADESLAEPHAPGWHAREVAALRAVGEGASLVLAGPSVSLEAERMVAVGWLTPVSLPRTILRERMPRVETLAQAAHGDPARAASRVPSVVVELLRDASARGPVLVSVPRAGYLPFLVCQGCREQALCSRCAAPLRADGPERLPVCPQHRQESPWRCPHCGGDRLRAGVVGVRRTAEEFGRALPGVPVIASSAEHGVLRSMRSERGVVVATPGAEPVPAPPGYAALVLLDVAAALSRPGLRVGEEVLRRWLLAASLVRSADAGGQVLVVGPESPREVQALVRWDPRGYAHRELDERLALALPPAVRTARLTGPAIEVGTVVDRVRAELGPRVRRCSGPLPVAGPDAPGAAPGDGSDPPAGQALWLVGVGLADGAALAALLQHEQTLRSARRAAVVTVRMDPARG